MQKPWLKSYPADVPAEIDTSKYGSLVDLLEEAFKKYAKRDAAACMGKHITYGEIDRMSQSMAAWLQSLGLKRGARVAIMMPNVLQYTVALSAILRGGFVVVNVNPLYTPRELEYQLKDSGAEAIVVLENFAATLQQVIEKTPVKHVVLASMGDLLGGKGVLVNFVVRNLKKLVPPFELPLSGGRTVTRFNDTLAKGGKLSFKRPQIGADDVAFLQYTGGTTGVSKGAVLLNRNVVANTLQVEAWFAKLLYPKSGEQVTAVCALPLYHIFALTACYLLGCRIGALTVLIPNPRDIAGFIKTLRNYKVNMFPAVNTLFNGLAMHPDFAKVDFSRLVISNGGGTAVQQATADRWEKITGCKIVEGYGLSETSPVATVNRPRDGFTGTIGLPVSSTDISIRGDDGLEMPLGSAGEICIRGPQVMAGYWNLPEETANVMTPDGFFKSGDIGVMDEAGFVKIVDRKKDMILVSGFNVYPNEIEQVVNLMPGVVECAAIGIADERSGEAVKLFVVRDTSNVTEEALMAHCRENLTAYKRPKQIEFRTDLPKTNVGKILRRALRDKA
jgi:long-chain acyl-CoA synthetase